MGALFSKRVIVAAAKLAISYTVLVVLAFAALAVAFAGSGIGVEFGLMAAWLSIPFAGAFLLLAVARRWGLLALWGILGGFWFWLVLDSESLSWPRQLPLLFMLWSVFALPLWVIGQAGFPRTSLRRISPSMAVLICWAVLLITPELFGLPRIHVFPPTRHSLADLIALIWAPIPLILSTFAIGHVWRGTARPVAV